MPYFGRYFGTSSGAAPPVAPVGGDFPAPSVLAAVYATDEDCVRLCHGDFGVLVPSANVVADGADGAFAAGYPWVLQSASNDFVAQGVRAGMVVQLTGPPPTFKTPQALAVASATSSTLQLRRCGMALGQGKPPAPQAGLTGVAFTVKTLYPQIEDVAFKLNEQFSLDPKLPGYRSPADVYDPRVFRALTVYRVFWLLYLAANRDKRGDFADKIAFYRDLYESELATASVRWGPTGTSQPPTSRGSMRIAR